MQGGVGGGVYQDAAYPMVKGETVPSILIPVARGSCFLRSDGPLGPEDPFQSAQSSDRFLRSAAPP